MAGAPGGHRQPQQSRSRETVERILAAADDEIGAVGLYRASTTSIAQRAGLSVGALYRFFRDKDEIANALAAQYLQDVGETFSDVVGELNGADDMFRATQDLIDRAALEQLRHPGYYRLTAELDPGPEDSPAHQIHSALRSLFMDALRGAGLQAPEAEIASFIDLCLEMVRHVLVLAPADEPARGQVVDELKVMLPAYLAARFPELNRV